ncbi:IS110 family transposase [Pectobacterium betavasculorum]|uniref:IS110 family transposase n=1 Tax=Pectobacterium betavasculorum TaxID=55207 RepID=UPI00313E3D85
MFYVGIDVSKRSVDVCLLAEGTKGKRKTKTLANGKDSAQILIKWLALHQCDLNQTHVIVEATGIYHEYLACGLHQMRILVSVVNPCRSREFAKAMGIFTKTDAVDAYVLASYGCLKQPDAWFPPTEEIRKLRALLQHRDSLLNDKLRIDNRLGTLKSTEAIKEVLDSLLSINQNLKDEIARAERLISNHIAQHNLLKNDLTLLMSIDGIGKQIGWNMLALLRGNDFKSAEQVAAYLGVAPVERRSGTSVHGRTRMSKIGPSSVRAKLYMGALTAIRKNNHVKALYERLLAKGKMKMSALGAAMRKLVHLCYGVLHTQQPYERNYQVK